MKSRMRYLILMITLLLGTTALAQHVWWTPEAPAVGQPFTMSYDSRIGVLGPNITQVWMHWGVVDDGGNWSAPPASIWPAGSQLSVDGYACQSPMVAGADTVWTLYIDPDTSIRHIEFVFTDLGDNWDNNSGANWRIDFVTGEVVAWWSPEEPEPGDLVTIYYNTIPGALPDGATTVLLHWGINEPYHGAWIEPPASMWPTGTVPWGDGHAVQTPMNSHGGGIWSVSIQSNDTTYTIHFVTLDGVNWDGNGGANWDIILEEPPEPVLAHHVFAYDPRSAFAGYIGTISSVNLAGTFNGWSTSNDPLDGPDENGVWMKEFAIPAGTHEYKFVLNGSNWQNDPDNPNFAPGGYHNNLITVLLDTLPQIYQFYPPEGDIYRGATADISPWAKIRKGDLGPGLQGNPSATWDGTPSSSVWYPASDSLRIAPITASPGEHEIAVMAQDSAARNRTATRSVWVVDSEEGFYALDSRADDFGPGSYTDPFGTEGDADLLGFVITEAANGDSLAFMIEMDVITEQTRVMMHIMSDIAPPFAPTAAFSLETEFPDWNGRGVAFVLGDTTTGATSPALLNTLYLSRSPLTYGAGIELDPVAYSEDRFEFKLAVADLEAVMGNYQTEWYFSCCAFLAQTGGPANGDAYEVDAAHGGDDNINDPDIFDVIFLTPHLQNVLLMNWSDNRTATFDANGRGFVAIHPDSIGPNVFHSGPIMKILSRGAPTLFANQELTGTFESEETIVSINLYQNANPPIVIPTTEDTFTVDVTLVEGLNTFYLEGVDAVSDTGRSSQTVFELVVNHTPNPVIDARVEGDDGILDASASTDPDSPNLGFAWTADEDNPEEVTLTNPDAAVASFALPEPTGEYFFSCDITEATGPGVTPRTVFTVYDDSVDAFELDESTWNVRDAIIYEIYPRAYSTSNHLAAITADMERIAGLGVNYIWLTPTFPGPTEHGYEIVDYYGVEEDLGSEQDMRDLINAAHSHGIRVMLDLVINHTSIRHPFMQDALRYGRFSHYWDYYDRDASGNYTYYYDWASMPNLNFDNPEVVKYFIDVSKYWVDEYGIDGYRCDVAWGPQSRTPSFWPQWHNALKQLYPDILLLAEMDAIDFNNFYNRFDLVYDWALHHSGTESFADMFQGGIPSINNLHTVITNYGFPYPPYKYPFRFLENHDEGRYISYNTTAQTKLAALLLFTIDGVPLIYAGQEVGETSQRGLINWSGGPQGLSHYYYKLCQLRKQFPSIRSPQVERITNSQSSVVYSYLRYIEGELPIIVALNMASNSQVTSVTVPTADIGIHPDSTYYLSELLTGTYLQRTGAELTTIVSSLSAYQGRVWVIADEPIQLDAPEQSLEIPEVFALRQNYPNPFNPTCTIPFEISSRSRVTIAIYNVMGQQVKVLTDDIYSAGVHQIVWDGHNQLGSPVGSGIYFYRMHAGDFVSTRKMILLR
ncbi:T9SS type A sorting domain-containing protein [bacterium]|nr:T9SS type A sorting domain-containing protein [bacterium]